MLCNHSIQEHMKTKKIWANLAVSDLEQTTEFYTALGFTPNGRSEELTSFLVGEDNFIIHFFLEDKSKADLNGGIAVLKQENEVIFSLSAESKAEVEEWADIVVKAGGTIFSGPKAYQKGHFLGFSDPDGHKLNVLYWPK